MKIFFGVLSALSVLGVLLLVFTPYIYGLREKTFSDWQERLLAYRPAWVLICAAMLSVSVAGWQNSGYNDTGYSGSDSLSSYAKNQYPIYNSAYKVLKVTDGNSAEVQLNKGPAPVNLIGVDMFKNNTDSRQNACYKQHASSKLNELLSSKRVELEGDDSLPDPDKSDTLLRYLISNNKNVGKEMIALGYARASTGHYKYHDEFLAAEKHAKVKKMGLWSDDICAPSVQSAAAPSARTSTDKSHVAADNNKTRTHPHRAGSVKESGRTADTGGKESDDRENNSTPNCFIKLPLLGCL